VNIGVCGASGRMGRAVLATSLDRSLSIGAAFEWDGCPFLGRDAGEILGRQVIGTHLTPLSAEGVAACDVIVDFSSPDATLRLIDMAVASKKALVICTTGLDDAARAKITEASKQIPVVFSGNMSIGVNLMLKLVAEAAKTLGEGFDVEVLEAHHRKKKDSPSGTALMLIDAVKKVIPRLAKGKEVRGRDGIIGERTDDEIGVSVIRGGDIVGEHTVFFISPEERIEITHRASSRELFAKGAVRAAEFAAGRAPGLYTMTDVLGL
jgi:4-hydroxy-tetrahydrodipicolinate reductase